jgi:uncharacterized GH25 family protein
LKNPYSLKVGDEMSFLLKYNGKALANQVVHCSSRGNDEIQGTETMLKTDAKGRVSFKIDKPGHWYVATIRMIESDREGYDYESNWATLTFGVK